MSTALRFLSPSQVRAFERPGSVGLRIEIADERTILNARVRRAFPLSHSVQFVSIQDGSGAEVGLLETMEGLPDETRSLMERELDRRYFTPRIERIDRLKMEAGMWHFSVATHRGDAEFYVRNWRDSAHELTPGRWHINTVDGGRFEILDVEAMDAKSRRLMDQLL